MPDKEEHIKKTIPEHYFKNLRVKIVNTVNDLQDDIPNEAPILHSLGKGSAYLTPEGYFKILINNTRDSIIQLDDPDVLQEIEKRKSYRVPEVYFERLQSRTMAIQPSKGRIVVMRWFRGLAAAAVISFALVWGWLYLQNSHDSKGSGGLEMHEAFAYYIEHIEEIDEHLLIDLSTSSNLDPEIIFEELTDNEVEYYIEENIDDFDAASLYDIM